MNTALIFAGGTGKRMNSRSKPKQFLEMHGKPIIIYTLKQRIVPGGATGHDSIYNGLAAMKGVTPDKGIVLIHDGVRPLINVELISENLRQ